MSNLRRLFQRDPETGSRLLIYLHSPDEPIAARVVAVLSLSHLWTDSAVEFLGGLLKNPPDVKVAGAVAWGYHLCSFRDEPSWGDVLEHLVPMGLSKSYGFSNHMISGYCTKASAPDDFDVSPMLEGILAFVERPDAVSFRVAALYLANEFCNRRDASESSRERYRKQVEAVYLKGEPGWHFVLNSLTFGSRVWTRAELIDLLGRGLAHLEDWQLAQVLDEVSRDPEGPIAKPPFSGQFERATAYLARSPEEGGPEKNSFSHLRSVLKDAGKMSH